MKTKFLIAFFAFIAAFSLSAISAGLIQKTLKPIVNSQIQSKLYNFLQKDAQNRQESCRLEKDSSGRNVWSFIERRSEYADASEKMTAADLPEDFRRAWKDHTILSREWVEFIKHLDSMPDETVLNREEQKIAERKIAEQNDNWSEIVSIAHRYGVEISSNGAVSLAEN